MSITLKQLYNKKNWDKFKGDPLGQYGNLIVLAIGESKVFYKHYGQEQCASISFGLENWELSPKSIDYMKKVSAKKPV